MKLKTITLILSLILVSSSFAQDCYNMPTYKLISKKKKDIKKEVKNSVKEWIINSPDSLNLPKKIKLDTMVISPEESSFWETIDSMLCEENSKANQEIAIKLLTDRQLMVFRIDGYFHMEGATVKSLIDICFDINGRILYIFFYPSAKHYEVIRIF